MLSRSFSKLKVFIIICFSILILSFGLSASADMGPKPAINIEIVGIEGKYVAAFAAQEAFGPNFDYERYKEEKIDWLEYNPIMEYQDAEGYKWITKYFVCEGDSKISFGYYRPEQFKLIIYQDDVLYKVTDFIDCYAFNSVFKIDFSDEVIKITMPYDYGSEVLNFFIRLGLTLVIELGLFIIFRLYTKRNFIIVLITNLITQIALNLFLNLTIFYDGNMMALFLLFICEFFIFIIETTVYVSLLKDKNKAIIVLYALLANLLSFGIGYLFIK